MASRPLTPEAETSSQGKCVMKKKGFVYLVGAGPGDPELLTVKAQRLLGEAEAVVYDRLVSPAILDLVPRGAMLLSVGKEAGNHPVPQEEINDLLVGLAGAGHKVVRLKGGDPYIFGRGSEEAAHLAAQGIPFEAVPGVTAASGCTAELGIPLTHRGLATSVRFVTGHCRADADLDLDWKGLADPDTTLVIYMGRATMPRFAAELIKAGLSPSTPVAVVCNGTQPNRRFAIGTLAGAPALADDPALKGPVLFVVGRVVELSKVLGPAEEADADVAVVRRREIA